MESDEPRIFQFADPGLQIPPVSWTVVPPSISDPDGLPSVLLASDTGTILTLTMQVLSYYGTLYLLVKGVTDQLLHTGPFKKMCLSPNGKVLACFSNAGVLWVVSSDFTKELTQFVTEKTSAPDQMAWCVGF